MKCFTPAPCRPRRFLMLGLLAVFVIGTHPAVSLAEEARLGFEFDLDSGNLNVMGKGQTIFEIARLVRDEKHNKIPFNMIDIEGDQGAYVGALNFETAEGKSVTIKESPAVAGNTLRVPAEWQVSQPEGEEAQLIIWMQFFISFADNPGLAISTDKGDVLDFNQMKGQNAEELIEGLKGAMHVLRNVNNGVTSVTLSQVAGQNFIFEFPGAADLVVFFPTWNPTWFEDQMVGINLFYVKSSDVGEKSGFVDWTLRVE